MRRKAFTGLVASTLLFLGAAPVMLTPGCGAASRKESAATAEESASGEEAARPAKGAAQLWAENCVRCHNSRSPSSYSDTEWDVAMHHMRVRANLTADEYRTIVEFMKAAN